MDLTPFLVSWRTAVLPDREVVDALVHPSHAAPRPSRELSTALETWPGRFYWSNEADGHHLILTRPHRRRRRERWALHVALFLITFVTTTIAGTVLAGAAPTSDPFELFAWVARYPPDLFRVLSTGLAFSIPLLAFLLSHELGHYITARWYQLDASPPYFIPVPLFPSFIGTMGAFIRLRTVLADRRQLFDVGVAGPITGFAVALPVLWIGLATSHELPGHGALGGMLLDIGGQTFALGDSLLTLALRWALHGRGSAVLLDPLAAAGWFGVFVTMLNLLPISQLDGGHILYGMLPRWHGRAAVAFWILIMLLGWFSWGWIVWAILILALSRGRLGHPPVLDAYRPVPPSRRLLAWGTLGLFLLTFTPVPFRM